LRPNREQKEGESETRFVTSASDVRNRKGGTNPRCERIASKKRGEIKLEIKSVASFSITGH